MAHNARSITTKPQNTPALDPALCAIAYDNESAEDATLSGMDDEDITQLQLDVYMTREGPWNPEHGDIEIPKDWDFLPSGDAFVTRRVNSM